MEEARKWEHHKQSDCFVLFILSHGSEGGVYGTDGESLPIKDVWKSFSAAKCPDLIGKTKIVLLSGMSRRFVSNFHHGDKIELKPAFIN